MISARVALVIFIAAAPFCEATVGVSEVATLCLVAAFEPRGDFGFADFPAAVFFGSGFDFSCSIAPGSST